MYISCGTKVHIISSPDSDSSDLEMMSVASHARDSSETKQTEAGAFVYTIFPEDPVRLISVVRQT